MGRNPARSKQRRIQKKMGLLLAIVTTSILTGFAVFNYAALRHRLAGELKTAAEVTASAQALSMHDLAAELLDLVGGGRQEKKHRRAVRAASVPTNLPYIGLSNGSPKKRITAFESARQKTIASF